MMTKTKNAPIKILYIYYEEYAHSNQLLLEDKRVKEIYLPRPRRKLIARDYYPKLGEAERLHNRRAGIEL